MSGEIQPPRGDIAIVGVACTYPKARRAGDFWQNIVARVDAITDVDPSRWDPDVFYDPDPAQEDRLYSKRGGWIPEHYSFNPLRFGIPPASIQGAEPDHCLLFRCVFEALEDAGYVTRSYDTSRVSVIIGKGNYVGPGLIWLTNRTVVVEMIIRIMKQMRPDLTRDQQQRLRAVLRSKMPRLTPESAGGMVPNIATGRIANRLDFMGRNFSVDAACASTLVATEIAVNNLLTGIDDMSIVGGLHIYNDVPFLSVFKVARAISLTSTMRPFDEHADGTMCGEGVGSLVLKRLADAERDGDRIYAVVKGVGIASDGKGKAVMAPRLEGEVTAIRRAFEMAQVPPQSLELIECHGTATTVGDATELEALETVYGPAEAGRPVCAIGSVKSMIGHAMPASGAASLIKTALALYHRILPPTLNVTQPHPTLRKPDTRFYLNTESKPWIRAQGATPRRAAVSAFGFGGINGHVILEEYTKAPESENIVHLREWESEVLVIEAEDRAGLLTLLDRLRTYAIQVEGIELRDLAWTLNSSLSNRPHRVSIVASSLEEFAQKIDRVKELLSNPGCNQIRDRGGLYYFGGNELRDGKVAFLFPGEGSQYIGMLADLCMAFPEVRACFDRADAAIKDPHHVPLSAVLYPPPSFSDEEEAAAEAQLWSIERATEAVLTAGGAIHELLSRFGVRADMMTGHSAGEWIAMAASGMVDIGEFVSSMDRLAGMYGKLAESTEIPVMAMLAVGAGREKILDLAAQIGCEVYLANDNCPHQVVAVAHPDDAPQLIEHLLKSGVFVERLPYDRGYHTPSFTYICEPLREFFRSLNIQAPKSPVYSCTTTEPYSHDAGAILETVANTFARPLLFRQTIERMYADGARVFIECGPRGNLTAFVDDILRGRPHLTVPMDVFHRSGIAALNHAMGMLAAAHVKLDLAPMYARRAPRRLALDAKSDSVLPEEQQPGVIQISIGYRLLDLESNSEFPMPTVAAPAPGQFTPAVEPARTNGTSHVNGTHAPSNRVEPIFAAESESRALDLAPAAAVPAGAGVPASAGLGAPQASGPYFTPHQSTMADHFALMEQFLHAEEEIMCQAFFGGGAPSALDLAPGYSAPAPVDLSALQAPGLVPYVQALPSQPVAAPATPATVEPAMPAAAPEARTALAAPDPSKLLLKIVSERTGYPEEMLGLDQDMEADLGIDSIKRVEIFGALRDLSGNTALSGEGDMEGIAKLKTLRDVLAFLGGKATASTPEPSAAGAQTLRAMLHASSTVEETPGQSITLRLALDLDEHKYLRDHSLYFLSTERDNQADRIFVMPQTGSVELMCEVAALLQPAAKVIGVRDVQAFRRLSTTAGQPVVIDVSAKRMGPAGISVSVRGAQGGAAYSSCVVQLGSDYPQAPAPAELILTNPKSPICPTGKDIYDQHRMFHGPSFQGVHTVDRVGENGLLATLEILPNGDLFGSNPNPQYYLDPHLLDAAGQLVGYWPVEYLSEGYVILPIRIAEVAKFCDSPPVGSVTRCRMRIREVAQRTVLADYDILHPDGTLWIRVTGWEDWRFFWKPHFFDFWRFSNIGYCSTAPSLAGLEKSGFQCRHMSATPDYEKDSLSEEVLTHVLLDRQELAEYQALRVDDRSLWLAVRLVAKDSIRAWAKRTHNRDLYPADIHLVPVDGGFQSNGFWSTEFVPPQVSTCICSDAIFAVAGPERSTVAAAPADESGTELDFLPDELEILDRLASPSEWKTRGLTAKLAVGGFLRGNPDRGYVRSLIVRKVGVENESFEIADPDMAINAEDTIAAVTGRFEGMFVAVAFLKTGTDPISQGGI
jgi:acyl transferase domain-containing protein